MWCPWCANMSCRIEEFRGVGTAESIHRWPACSKSGNRLLEGLGSKTIFVEGPLAWLDCPYGAAKLLAFRMCPMAFFKCKMGGQTGQTAVFVEGHRTLSPLYTHIRGRHKVIANDDVSVHFCLVKGTTQGNKLALVRSRQF